MKLTRRFVPRLFLAFFLLSPLPLGGLAWLHLEAFERTLHETVLANLAAIADKKAEQINTYIDERLTDGRMLARLAVPRAAFRVSAARGSGRPVSSITLDHQRIDLTDFFSRLLSDNDFYDLLLIDAAGNVIFSIRRESDLGTNLNTGPYRDSLLAQAHRKTVALLDTQITRARPYAPTGDKPAIFFVLPVTENGKLLGTLALQLDLDRLIAVSNDRTGLGETGETILAQREGDAALYVGPLRHSADAALRRSVPVAHMPPPMRAGLSGEQGNGLTVDHVGTPVVAAWRHLPALEWSMVVKMDAREAFAPLDALRHYSLAALLALLFLASATALFFGRGMVLPIRRLVDATERLTAGDLRQHAPATGCEEFRELADSFNLMASRLAEEQAQLENRIHERTRELAESEQRLNQAQSLAHIGSWHLDITRNRLDWSAETFRIFGITDNRPLSYEDFLACVHPDDRTAVDAAWQAALKGAPYDIVHRIVVAGAIKWVRERAELVFGPDGALIAGTGTVQDITEQQLAKIALEHSRAAAEAANRAKSAFLANMSHEIRTPMNAILGLTQLVLDSPLSDEQRDYLQKALSSGRALLGILNDILDYSKIEAGRLEIEQLPFSPARAVREVGDLFSAQAAEKGLKLALDIAPDLPPTVVGDPLRLRQVLANLVGNAIKFTERGEVRVLAGLGSDDEGDLVLHFAVRDTGIGIDRQIADRLFQPFTQADGSITRKFGGTGLGLAICHRLVTLMGGKIAASGEPGRGATFSFSIRVGRAHAPCEEVAAQKSAPAPRRFDGARMLVVEDNPFNQQVAAGFLKKLGIAVTLADDGAQALAIAANADFDAVLMDMHMPTMDGLEATRRLRNLARTRDTPIIAMTAAVMEEDRRRCREAGMSDFLPKPIDPDELLAVLARHLPDLAPAGGPQPPPVSPAPAAPSLPDLPGFDLPAALRRVGGDGDLLLRLIKDFIAEQRDFVEPLAALLEAGEIHEAAIRLHALKGAAANLGAEKVAEAARRLEAEVRAGNRAEFAAFVAHLRAALEAAANAFAGLNAEKQPSAAPRLDAATVAALLEHLRPYLEERELIPDALLHELSLLARDEPPGGMLATLLHRINEFDHDGALATLAQLAALLGINSAR